MNPRLLDHLLGSHVSVRVLRQLCLFPTKEHTGREIARLADVSPSKGIKALGDLYAHGLVRRRTVGASQLWRLQEEHILVSPFSELFRIEERMQKSLYDDLRRRLRKIPYVASSTVFGSIARGDSTSESDVDLLVVVDASTDKERLLQQLTGIRVDLERKFGILIRPIVYSRREWARKKSSPLVKNIRREGITIVEARA